MVNAYYDIPAGDFTPFVMGGVGFMRGKFKTSQVSFSTDGVPANNEEFKLSTKNTSKFAWNIGAGVAYNIDSNMKLELMYKLANSIKAYKLDTKDKVKLSGGLDHSVMAGVRYHF